MSVKIKNKFLVLLSLIGGVVLVDNAEAYSRYMVQGNLPSCSVCHLSTPIKGNPVLTDIDGNPIKAKGGLQVYRKVDFEGNILLVPYYSWNENGEPKSSNPDKMNKYCIGKLKDEAATMQYGSWLCGNGDLSSPKSGRILRIGYIGSPYDADAATDVWDVSCKEGTSQLTAAVSDRGPKNPEALISIRIVGPFNTSEESIDNSESDSRYSNSASVADGAVHYQVNINKSESSKVGAEGYIAKFECKSATGRVLGVESIVKQVN